MTFDFFNTSNLAFGQKISAVFKTLNNQAQQAEDNIETILYDLTYYKQYINRNYQSPVPTTPSMPVRTNELYKIIDEIPPVLELALVDGVLNIKVRFFSKNSNLITIAQGTTTNKTGYVFVTPSISYDKVEREIRVGSEAEPQRNEILLFRFRIDTQNKIHLLGDTQSFLKLYPQDASQYKSLSVGRSFNKDYYKADDYICVAVVTEGNSDAVATDIRLNGNEIIAGLANTHYGMAQHSIFYLKPGDYVSGNKAQMNSIFEIKYND